MHNIHALVIISRISTKIATKTGGLARKGLGAAKIKLKDREDKKNRLASPEKCTVKEYLILALFVFALCLASLDSPIWKVFILTKIVALGLLCLVGGICVWKKKPKMR